jgi:multisubunit Na+/H+ antiporter MnhE subunit
VESVKELAARAHLGSWDSWSTQYRVLAVVVGLLVAYWALRAMVPTVLRILRPVFFVAIVLAAVWALYPAETCSIEFLSRLPFFCAH